MRINRWMAVTAFLTTLAGAGEVVSFADGIRKTEPLTPEQQAQTFTVPAGWKVQLVAAEPQIDKPMNMAFDARGRLWVTVSREYPYPAKEKGKDSIKILEDFGPDGRARKVTTFAEGLNIPIGLYPYKNGVIAFSIPNMYFFQDTDGDGKSDKEEILYGPFGFKRDTHGMTSAFRRGFDGWLYACHGFSNHTSFKARDGSSITMQSGNTYRVTVDGNRVEQHTWGQVNPFGLAFDPLGNLYSADCHSSPIYQLLRGAYYPSFGKKDDGLGFGPTMMNHNHGSTAIGGIVFAADDRFPAEFKNNIFVGNVMTSRVNRDQLEDHGSTRLAKEVPDLLSTTDPWFRPVDLQLGPDGAIYVADFYNRIIGHYEVPLDHPGRDRERGRIWRIIYDGAHSPAPDLSKANAAELIQALGSGNLTLRMLATDQLTDRIGKDAIEPLKAALKPESKPTQKIHALWALHRLGGCEIQSIGTLARDPDAAVRTHAFRVFSETPPEAEDHDHPLPMAGLEDPDAFVRRAAADAMGRRPHRLGVYVRPLSNAREKARGADTHLEHAIRMALRNQFLKQIAGAGMTEPEVRNNVADVLLAVNSVEAGRFLARNLAVFSGDANRIARYVRHAVEHLPAEEATAVAGKTVHTLFADDPQKELTLIHALQEELARRNLAIPDSERAWILELATKGVADTGLQLMALDLAVALKFPELQQPALSLLRDKGAHVDVRVAAAKLVLQKPENAEAVLALIKDGHDNPDVRARLAEVFAAANTPQARDGLFDALRLAPAKLQPLIALAVLRNPESGEALLEQARAGKIPVRIFLARSVRERLQSYNLKDLDARVTELTKGLKTLDGEIQKTIDVRRNRFDPAKASAENGAKIFEKTCAVCHQLDGKGALVGPQLDGVGARGLERILEDVLDPNRNVDGAFKYSVLKLKDGRIVNGLQRREEGATLIFADSTGKELGIAKDEIVDRKESAFSLMPDNFGESITPEDLNHLLGYLLSKAEKK